MPLTQGLYHIYTGDGKGKTTAAVGQAVRAHGAGLRVCFVQFVKGGRPSSELAVLAELGIEVVRPAEKSSGTMRGTVTDDDRHAVAEAWDVARAAIQSGEWDLVVMDEAHIALKYGLLDLYELLDVLTSRPHHVEVITTGRNAPELLQEAADYVLEMTLRKHPYQRGIPARLGIEY